jgi:hypothetical protein
MSNTKKCILNSLIMLLAVFSSCKGEESVANVLTCSGASDASAGAAVSENMFVVADDENNTLRIYQIDSPTNAVFSLDLTEFLAAEAKNPEADIEGATSIGNRIYWITSHGRNKDGKMRPSRYRFFATEFDVNDSNVTIRPAGKPCKTLIHRLLRTDYAKELGLDTATQLDVKSNKLDLQKLAPKSEGLNIEALCASADAKTIYIGFRNPRPYDKTNSCAKALVIPLENAADVIDKQEQPVFGKPILWDLHGLGLRSMEYSQRHKTYFIIAGPHDEKRQSVLYRWSGQSDQQPVLVRELSTGKDLFSFEALIPFKNTDRLLLLSDDGTLKINIADNSQCAEGMLLKDGTCLNKHFRNPDKKYFRAIWLEPEAVTAGQGGPFSAHQSKATK